MVTGILTPVLLVLSIFITAPQWIHCDLPTPVARDDQRDDLKFLVPDLPLKHYQFWLKNHPKTYQRFVQICSQVPQPLALTDLKLFKSLHEKLAFENPRYLEDLDFGKNLLNLICEKIRDIPKSCWGFENNCDILHLMPECHNSSPIQTLDGQEQKTLWFNQGDFGYLLHRRRELGKFCLADKHSNHSVKSSLECTKYFRTCRGDNLRIDFSHQLKDVGQTTDQNDLIKQYDVGGWNCDLQLKRIQEESGQEGVLQSWFSELKNYRLILNEQPDQGCDLSIKDRVFFVKLDSPANLYHYLCTFLNLYATMHFNNKLFSNNQIVIWDDKLPKSKFETLWSAFSKNPPRSLADFEGKRVCFGSFMFSLLPRMVDGLYYGATLVPGCSKSGLFDAFNKHILHRLNISQDYNDEMHQRTQNRIIRVLILSRSTPFRRILNERELKSALKGANYSVELVDFVQLDFVKTLEMTHNTDILVGIHGAGLTNVLFLPDWAAIIELYDCKDKAYYDLARLRGVSYFAMPGRSIRKVADKVEPSSPNFNQSNATCSDDKFCNYEINPDAFSRLVEKASAHVRQSRLKLFRELEKPIQEVKRAPEEKTSILIDRMKKKPAKSREEL